MAAPILTLRSVVLIGYSGHSLVVHDVFASMGRTVVGYCEASPKEHNPLDLEFFGDERSESTLSRLAEYDYFVAIGDNQLRRRVQTELSARLRPPLNAVHGSAVISSSARLGHGVLVGPRAVVNAFSFLGDGVICNSASVVEHECEVGDFAHICPAAVLAGNVKVGECAFVGASSVIIQRRQIGEGALIGAGSVVISDIAAHVTAVGNPCRALRSRS